MLAVAGVSWSGLVGVDARQSPDPVVETVAGPGFCPGRTVVDPASLSVRSLAVDPRGVMYVDAGRPRDALVVRVGASGDSTVIPALPAGERPVAGRLAANARGGFLVATPSRLVDYGEAVVPVAGADRADDAQSASGDGGPALDARFRAVRALASDGDGNAYVADEAPGGAGAVRIRFVNRGAGPVVLFGGTGDERTLAPGAIDTVAGGADRGPQAGDGGRALGATFTSGSPAIAALGTRLYVAVDAGRDATSRVVLVNLGREPLDAHGTRVAPGAAETVLGTPSGASGAQPSQRATPQGRDLGLSAVGGLSADQGGNLFVAETERNRVLKLDGAGAATLLAGSQAPGAAATGGFDGNDRPAAGARLDRPLDVEAGPGGRVFISDSGNGQVRVVEVNGVIRPAFGNGAARRALPCRPEAGTGSERGRVPPALEGGVAGLASDPAGNVYIALRKLRRVVRLGNDGAVTMVAGDGSGPPACVESTCPAPAGDGGAALDGALRGPSGLALGPNEILYVVDVDDLRVRAVNLGRQPRVVNTVTIQPGAMATVAGTGRPGFGGDAGPALKAELDLVRVDGGDPLDRPGAGIAVDGAGNVYLAETNGMRRIDAAGEIRSFVNDCCRAPAGLAVDPAGNLYVSDTRTGRVWFVNQSDQPVSRHGRTFEPHSLGAVVGNGRRGFSGDRGPAVEASVPGLGGLALDAAGNLYLTHPDSSGDNAIRRVDPEGIITTLVGGGRGFNGDGLKAAQTTLLVPSDLAVDRCGNLLFSELNDRVRRVNLTPCGEAAQASAPAEAAAGASTEKSSSSGPWIPVAVVALSALAVTALAVTGSVGRPSGHGSEPGGPT